MMRRRDNPSQIRMLLLVALFFFALPIGWLAQAVRADGYNVGFDTILTGDYSHANLHEIDTGTVPSSAVYASVAFRASTASAYVLLSGPHRATLLEVGFEPLATRRQLNVAPFGETFEDILISEELGLIIVRGRRLSDNSTFVRTLDINTWAVQGTARITAPPYPLTSHWSISAVQGKAYLIAARTTTPTALRALLEVNLTPPSMGRMIEFPESFSSTNTIDGAFPTDDGARFVLVTREWVIGSTPGSFPQFYMHHDRIDLDSFTPNSRLTNTCAPLCTSSSSASDSEPIPTPDGVVAIVRRSGQDGMARYGSPHDSLTYAAFHTRSGASRSFADVILDGPNNELVATTADYKIVRLDAQTLALRSEQSLDGISNPLRLLGALPSGRIVARDISGPTDTVRLATLQPGVFPGLLETWFLTPRNDPPAWTGLADAGTVVSGAESTPPVVQFFNSATGHFTGYAYLQNSAGGTTRTGVVAPGLGRAFIGITGSPGRVIELDTNDRQSQRLLVLANGEDNLSCSAIDEANDIAWFGTDTAPGRIVAVRLSTMERIGATTLAAGEDSPSVVLHDLPNNKLIVGTGTNPPRVIRLNAATLAREGGSTLSTAAGPIRCGVLDLPSSRAIFGLFTAPGEVIAVSTTSLAHLESASFGSKGDKPLHAVLEPARRTIYMVCSGRNDVIVRIDPDPLRVHFRTSAFSSTNNASSAIIYRPDNQTLVRVLGANAARAIVYSTTLKGAMWGFRLPAPNFGSLIPPPEKATSVYFAASKASGNMRVVITELLVGTHHVRWTSDPVPLTAPNAWYNINISQGSNPSVDLLPGGDYWIWLIPDSHEEVFCPGEVANGHGRRLLLGTGGALPSTFNAIDTTYLGYQVFSAYLSFAPLSSVSDWDLFE